MNKINRAVSTWKRCITSSNSDSWERFAEHEDFGPYIISSMYKTQDLQYCVWVMYQLETELFGHVVGEQRMFASFDEANQFSNNQLKSQGFDITEV